MAGSLLDTRERGFLRERISSTSSKRLLVISLDPQRKRFLQIAGSEFCTRLICLIIGNLRCPIRSGSTVSSDSFQRWKWLWNQRKKLWLSVGLSSWHLPSSALVSGVMLPQTQQSFNLTSFFNVRAHSYFISRNKVHYQIFHMNKCADAFKVARVLLSL